jgi:SH3 domain protein
VISPRSYFLTLGLLLLLPIMGLAQQEKTMFITDRLQVTVRTGTSVENKIIQVLNSGDQVAVLKTEPSGWCLVRLIDGREGWMIARYLQEDKPALLRLKELDPKAKDLVQDLEELKKHNRQLTEQMTQAEKKLRETKEQYLKLQQDTANSGGLRAEHQKLKQELARRGERLDEMSAEVESLRFGSNLKWFLAGAAVLAVGWLMGLAYGRRKRRWTSSLL